MDTENRHIHHSKAFDQILGRIASCEDWTQLERITDGIDGNYAALGLHEGELELIIQNVQYRATKSPNPLPPTTRRMPPLRWLSEKIDGERPHE